MRRSIQAVIVLGTALASVASARAAAPSALQEPTVVVHSSSGSVRVVGGGRADVSVSGETPARVTRSGSTTHVRGASESSSLEVRVPSGARVEVRTQSGDISVSGVRGALDLRSMSGTFTVEGSPSSLTVEGISGGIHVRGSPETIRAKTVSGNIELPRARGSAEVTSVSGRIRVVSAGLRRATIRNVSGMTEFAGAVPRDGSLHLASVSGIVEIRVPAGMSARYDLSSMAGGDIENELGPAPARTEGPGPGSVVRFSQGSGGAEITARTLNGLIRIRRQ